MGRAHGGVGVDVDVGGRAVGGSRSSGGGEGGQQQQLGSTPGKLRTRGEQRAQQTCTSAAGERSAVVGGREQRSLGRAQPTAAGEGEGGRGSEGAEEGGFRGAGSGLADAGDVCGQRAISRACVEEKWRLVREGVGECCLLSVKQAVR